MKKKSILDLSLTELEEIVTKGKPEDLELTLEGLEGRKDFNKLFAKRVDIRALAEMIWKEKLKVEDKLISQELKKKSTPGVSKNVYQSPVEDSLRKERLELKKREIELKEKQVATQTQMYQLIYSKLQSLEDKLDEMDGRVRLIFDEVKRKGE